MRSKTQILIALSCLALPHLAPLRCNSSAHAAQNLYAAATCRDVMRSGDLPCPAPWAIPTDPRRYSGYYVGGGAGPCPCLSCPLRSCSTERCRDDGTWGWDYVGYYVSPFVRLGWWCPPHDQGGAGNYAPDGPHLCHDLVQHF